VPRVEEARSLPGRWELALQPGLGAGEAEAALLQCLGDRAQRLGRLDPVEAERGVLVGVEGGGVVSHRLGCDARHRDVDVEGAEVVAERDQVVEGGRLHIGQTVVAVAAGHHAFPSHSARNDAKLPPIG
jgi:hypothetical protein